MEARTVLRLSAAPRRLSGGRGYLEDDDDDDEVALSTPYASAPSTPRRAIARAAVEEAPLGEVRAAVPFVWELVPGTPKSDVEEGGPAERNAGSSDETEGRGSSSSAGGSETAESTLSRDSSNTEFEFSSRFAGVVEPLPPCRAAEELFSNGRLLPLRLPPRLQAVKNLQSANVSSSSDSSVSSSGSSQSYHSSPSPRIAGSPTKKAIANCGFSKPGDEAAVLGMRKALQRPRTLSPPRLFSRGSGSSDSVSWSSSSSSFSERKNGDSPQDCSPESEADAQASTLNDLLLTDITTASMRGGNSTMATTPRIVQSRRELLQRQQDQWNGFADAEKVDAATPAPTTPGLSRSHARLRPLIDVQVASSLKENVGRATFANRFGMLCSCVGMAMPESP